ncbi:MAG: winged helix-turn-helix domain-containing protein [Candidatus Woesearchaeota archaeon]
MFYKKESVNNLKIDRVIIKALSADTRVKILKLLEKRRHTQAELAANLNISPPAIKEHLTILENSGLVLKSDEGYKWKYYLLTEKAKQLLNPEKKKLQVLLIPLIFSIGGILLSFLYKRQEDAKNILMVQQKSYEYSLAIQQQRVSNFDMLFFIFVFLSIILFVIFLYYFIKNNIAKSRILRSR